MKIGKFRHKGLKRLYDRDDPKGLPAASVNRIRNMLFALESAADISQLETMPGWRVHPLKGERKGEWGLGVTKNWRLTSSSTVRL